MGLSEDERISMMRSAVLTQSTRVTDGRTDGIGVAYTRYMSRVKNRGCPSFPAVPTNVQLQRSKASRAGTVRRFPLPMQPTRGSGEHRKLPQLGLRRSPSRKRFGGVSCAIFMRFYASFSAFNSCLEMGDSYIPLLSDVPL